MATEGFNRLTFDLLEATVALYAQNNGGGAGALLVSDLRVENLRADEKWIVVQTRPTGATYPNNHPLVPEYKISIGRLFHFDLSNLAGFQTSNQQYVLDVMWNDEGGEGWHRATYYGVTIEERSTDGREVEGGIYDGMQFAAQYVVVTGAATVPPAPVPTLPPFTVRYLSSAENSQLYTFDPVAGWTAQLDTSPRAVIALDGSNNFSVTFAGHAAPALQILAADSKTQTIDFEVGNTPTAGDLPRLDFYVGATRIGSVTERGKLFCANLSAVAAPETAAGFLLGNLATPAATWDATGLQVTQAVEFFPTDLSPLLAWHRMEALANVSINGLISLWPGELINQPVLTTIIMSSPDVGMVTLTQTGTMNGLPKYTDGSGAFQINWTTSNWVVIEFEFGHEFLLYFSTDEVTDPTLVTTWQMGSGHTAPSIGFGEMPRHMLVASGGPRVVLKDGVRCVQMNPGDYFHCSDVAFDTSVMQLFCVARRALGSANAALPSFGSATGEGSLRWKAGKQSAAWFHSGAPIPVTGSLSDAGAWSVFELEKAATGTSLRLGGSLDGQASHAAFGAVQDYFFMGDAASSFMGGWVRQGLVYGRELTSVEADNVRMWLRANNDLA